MTSEERRIIRNVNDLNKIEKLILMVGREDEERNQIINKLENIELEIY